METGNDKETIYSTDPLVKTLLDIITPEECQHMIDISIPRMKQSLVCSSSTSVTSSGRTSMNTWIPHNHDMITKQIGEKIAKEVGMPLENAESFQVIYYAKDGEYRNHYDSWVHDGSEKTMRCMHFGGARMKTALCYLNDVESGGGTKMTKMNISIPPEKGKLLIFDNTISMEDHTRHPLSEHAGMPVIQGEKYAFNLWFRECNSRRLYKDFNPSYYEIADKSQENEATVDPFHHLKIY
jgi:prolyl 4-hydroxylase